MDDLTRDSSLPRRLNLGCGLKKLPDCVNVDLRPAVDPDLVWDLEKRPYPLPRNHFESIRALDVVEHLSNLQDFVEEAHDLLVAGGILEITTPHFSSPNSYTDPTHRHHLGYFSFDYFTNASQWSFYSGVRFEIAERLLVFNNGWLDRRIANWANRHPELYERRFAWLWPAWFLIFKLRAVKG